MPERMREAPVRDTGAREGQCYAGFRLAMSMTKR